MKAPTPKVDSPKGALSLRTPPILWSRQDRHFFFQFSLFCFPCFRRNLFLLPQAAVSNLPLYFHTLPAHAPYHISVSLCRLMSCSYHAPLCMAHTFPATATFCQYFSVMEQERGAFSVLRQSCTQSFPVVEVLLLFPVQSFYIGLAVHGVVAVGDCHLFLFSIYA